MADGRSPEKDYFSRREPSATQQTPRARRMPSETTYRARLTSVQTPGSPTTPRTPRTPGLGRSLSSNFNSPGLSFRQDDDWYVFEFSHRFLRAGLGGEADPRSVYRFCPSAQKRAGDYSEWLPKSQKRSEPAKVTSLDAWTQAHELWQMDLRDVDLALVGDKIERALREAIRDQLLVLDDTKKRKAILVLPSVMPYALLSLVCTKIFGLYPPPPYITLLSSPVMCTAAAGLRSALVVDVGWAATSVSAVYEYREIKQMSSIRSMRRLTCDMKTAVEAEYARKPTSDEHQQLQVSFDDAEEMVQRLAWVRGHSEKDNSVRSRLKSIPLSSSHPVVTIAMPFEAFADVTEASLISVKAPNGTANDENELGLSHLIYSALLKLPIDVREVCLQRIIFIGGGSRIPGLKARLLHDVRNIISTRGWDEIDNYGSAKVARRPRTVRRPDGPIATQSIVDIPSRHRNKDDDPDSTAPAHLQPPLPDPILARIKTRGTARSPAYPSTSNATREDTSGSLESGPGTNAENIENSESDEHELRSITSLGAWAGASLLAGLRMPGLVEIERERFLHHGLQGGVQTLEEKRKSTQQQQQLGRQSLGGALSSNTGWSLGVWGWDK